MTPPRWVGPNPALEGVRQVCEEFDGKTSETGWTMNSGGLKQHRDGLGRWALVSPKVIELMLHPTEALELGERAALELAHETLVFRVIRSRQEQAS